MLLANGSIVPLTMAGAAYQKGQIEQEETGKPEQPEEETEPDTEQLTTGQPDENDEADDEGRIGREVNNHGKEKTF